MQKLKVTWAPRPPYPSFTPEEANDELLRIANRLEADDEERFRKFTGETGDGSPAKKGKRSTTRGDARTKIIATLTKHHRYSEGSCLNLEPIANNELARKASVAQSSASAFFTREFKGYNQYRARCTDASCLVAALKLLNGEYSPHLLYGKAPPGEGKEDE